jgi:hypothetical protein
MSSSVLDEELVPRSIMPTAADAFAARRLVALANRSSRRSFLSWVGRASLAVMGGGFIDIWQTESAQAACTWQGPLPPVGRATCLCTELIGTNKCPNCCSGFWKACAPCSDEDNCCTGGQTHWVKLYDCCAPCSGGCTTNSICGSTRNQSCCSDGYCPDGGCSGKKVRCVRKICTNNNCP